MKKNNILIVIFLLSTFIYSQQVFQDVIYLKNGDVVKGTIIENVPNNYVKLETANRSIITFKYSEIEKFTKERLSTSDNSKITNQNKEVPATTKNVSFQIGGNVGYFSPSEEAISNIYGGGLVFGLNLYLWSSSNFGGGLSLEYYAKSGNPIEIDPFNIISNSSADISIIPITVIGLYRISTQSNIVPYFGAGGGIYLYNEKIKLELVDGTTASASISESTFGFHISGGIQIKLSTNAAILLGAKFSSGSISGEGGAGGSDVKIGGVSITGGIIF